ncbi:hypothetical protein I6B53_01325 [Schaalia sp. 19OD2882]|nr:hypothetical protein I6B53_01325 [Schaalia sp. 19OD2882]
MSWLRLNAWGLALLIPAIALAAAANSYRYVVLYRPWFEQREIVQSGSLTLASDDQASGATGQVAAFTPVLVEKVAEQPEEGPFSGPRRTIEGVQLWHVAVEASAPTDMDLAGCELSLRDAQGRTFDEGLATFAAKSRILGRPDGKCAPAGKAGPGVNVDGTPMPMSSGDERPQKWTKDLYVAVPEALTPTHLVVKWQFRPQTHVVELPSH